MASTPFKAPATPQAPSSQKAGDRPISFLLVDTSSPSSAITPSQVLTLYIRPEDLTRTDTSRMSVQQTLGNSVWIDNFGPSVPTININGHTGWRRPTDSAAGTDDGQARFGNLKNQVFNNWHARRQLAVKNGKDPDSIQLQFADQLDSFASVVAPLSFVLRRNRSRPLLMQYQISMIVMLDNIAQPTIASFKTVSSALTSAQTVTAGVTSIVNSINSITAQINNVSNYINSSIATPVAQFMKQTAAVFNAVQNSVNSIGTVTNSLIAVGRLSAQCGVNIFRSLAAVAGIPQQIKGSLMAIAGAYSNALCVLENVFTQQLLYPDYQPLYGSSNCSSTSGGRPPSALAGLNPFEYTNPQQTQDAVTASTTAQNAMKTMANTDIVQTPPSIATIGSTAQIAANGLVAA